jgi:hypothetical protein
MQHKAKKFLTKIFLSLSILASAHLVRLVWWAVAYYQIDMWLYYPSLVLPFILPLLIILSFFDKYVNLIIAICTIVVSLTFFYGVHFVGFREMFRTYRNESFLIIIVLVVLSILFLVNRRTKPEGKD